MVLKIFQANNNKVIKNNNSRINKIVVYLSKFNKLKNNKFENSICILNIKATENLFSKLLVLKMPLTTYNKHLSKL